MFGQIYMHDTFSSALPRHKIGPSVSENEKRKIMDAEPTQQQPPQQEPGQALFFCHLCHSEYRQPKLLKCLHTFCTLCLKDAVDVDGDDPNDRAVVCPSCSHVTHLPPEGVQGLTDNPFLQRVSSEYVTGVRSTIVAKSLSPQSARKHIEPCESYLVTSGSRRRFSEEMAHLKLSNLTDEQKTVSSRNLLYKADNPIPEAPVGFSEFRRGSVDRGEYTTSALEAVNNMSRLQGKLMSLQGEALRVTYAIDRINEHTTNWHQHKEDLKLEVQRRSHQFQIAAKRMERQILSQIESKAIEDQFYAELDRGKTDLRRNLKNILHEVSVLKSVHELGRYSEINELSPSLLGPSVGMSEVVLDMLSYQLDIPTKPIEEMVSVGFGNLITTNEESEVYVPELRDFIGVPMDEITPDYQASHDPKPETAGGAEAPGDQPVRGRSSVSRRSQAMASGSKRYASDLGLGRTEAQENLEQFQNARENLRSRRQAILRQGQSAREDHSPLRGEGRKLSWPNMRRSRVQSLDRSSNVEEKSRMGLRNLRTAKGEVAGSSAGDTLNWIENTTNHTEEKFSRRPEDLTMASPIIEEGVIPNSPQKVNIVEERIPGRLLPLTPSPGEKIASPGDKITSTDIAAILEGRRRAISLGSCSRNSSLDETTPPQSPTSSDHSGDFRFKPSEGSRPLRKALSSTADKRSKMEFLRENWQKRKEILIQSQGFVSSEAPISSGKAKSDSFASSPGALQTQSQITADSGGKDVSGRKTTPPHAVTNVVSKPLASASLPPSSLKQQKTQEEARSAPSSTKSVAFVARSPTITLTPHKRSFFVGNVPGKDADKTKDEDDADDDNEQEVTTTTTTITIPIAGQLLKDTQGTTSDVQTKHKVDGEGKGKGSVWDEEEEEEEIVMTETFSISTDLIEESAKAANTLDNVSSGSSKASSRSDNANAPSAQISTATPKGYHSVLYPSMQTTTVSSPPASNLKTSIITGTTLKAPSTTSLKTDTHPSSSTSSLTSSNMTTTTTTTKNETTSALRYPSRLGTRVDTSSTTTTTETSSSSKLTPATTTATTTTASTAAPAQPTTASTSSTSSYLGRYSRRHRPQPQTETIDVAALLANMYKPSSSVTSQEEESPKKEDIPKKDDEEKENVKNENEKQSGMKAKDQNNFRTTVGTNRGVIKYTFSPNNSVDNSKDSTSVSDKTASADLAQTTASDSDITVYKITQDVKIPQGRESAPVSSSSTQRVLTRGIPKIDTTLSVTIESKVTQDSPKNVQIGDALDPPQRSDPLLPNSPRNKKVDETFNQVESSRKRYDPSSPRSSSVRSSRRHTVEISKTIPDGVRLSDMYKPVTKETDLHRTIIEETHDEPAKDSVTSSTTTENVTPRSAAGSSSSSFTDSFRLFPSATGPVRIPGGDLASLVIKQTESDGAASPLSPLSPTMMTQSHSSVDADAVAGPASSNVARGKLRDIARKKKERWRRLTIS